MAIYNPQMPKLHHSTDLKISGAISGRESVQSRLVENEVFYGSTLQVAINCDGPEW